MRRNNNNGLYKKDVMELIEKIRRGERIDYSELFQYAYYLTTLNTVNEYRHWAVARIGNKIYAITVDKVLEFDSYRMLINYFASQYNKDPESLWSYIIGMDTRYAFKEYVKQ